MREAILRFSEVFASGVMYVGLLGLASMFVYYISKLVFRSANIISKGSSVFATSLMIIIATIVGGTKPIRAIVVWDDGLHDAGTIVSSNDLRNITFKWTYDDWIPSVATVSIKAYDIHTVNEDPNVDRGFYVCTGVPITDRTAMVLMETDATNYCYFVSQSYIPDAPVVTNGVYHIHSIGTNNVWIPIGLKIFEDSRIISPHEGDNNEQ